MVLKESTEKDYDKFTAELPEKECRWAVYDFEYTLPSGEGTRNKLCFIMWCVVQMVSSLLKHHPLRLGQPSGETRDSMEEELTAGLRMTPM